MSVGDTPAATLRELFDAANAVLDDAEGDLSDCPYFLRGYPGADPQGTCSYGCYDEPQCQTCIPREGWPKQRLDAALRELAERADPSLELGAPFAGPDDEDYVARPALGRTHPAGNGAV